MAVWLNVSMDFIAEKILNAKKNPKDEK